MALQRTRSQQSHWQLPQQGEESVQRLRPLARRITRRSHHPFQAASLNPFRRTRRVICKIGKAAGHTNCQRHAEPIPVHPDPLFSCLGSPESTSRMSGCVSVNALETLSAIQLVWASCNRRVLTDNADAGIVSAQATPATLMQRPALAQKGKSCSSFVQERAASLPKLTDRRLVLGYQASQQSRHPLHCPSIRQDHAQAGHDSMQVRIGQRVQPCIQVHRTNLMDAARDDHPFQRLDNFIRRPRWLTGNPIIATGCGLFFISYVSIPCPVLCAT